ncbi:hypothetical protein HN51_029988 [Arachis hypogaea]
MPMPLILEPSASEFVKLQKLQHSDFGNINYYAKTKFVDHSGVEPIATYGNLGVPLEWRGALEWVFSTWARMHTLNTGEAGNFLKEKLSHVALVYVINEESESSFFTRFFKWDSKISAMLKNSFQRKLTIVKNGGAPLLDVRFEIPSGFITRKWFSLTIL